MKFPNLESRRLAALASVALFLTGCASVEVQRGKDFASAGVQYTRATTALVDVATDAMIDADSEAMVQTKLPAAALVDPRFSPAALRERLKRSNDGLTENAKLYLKLKSSLASVEGYFTALQNLASNPQSEITASAVSTFADRVNGLNKVLSDSAGPARPVISEAQKTALSGLSKLVADQIHGAKVAAAPRRDAPIIGAALLLQGQILSLAETVIAGAATDRTNRFDVANVQGPYIRQDIDAAWVADRNKLIKSRAVGSLSRELQAARAASDQMGKVWEKILSGVYDTSEIRSQIVELEGLTAALVAVKQAEKPKAP